MQVHTSPSAIGPSWCPPPGQGVSFWEDENEPPDIRQVFAGVCLLRRHAATHLRGCGLAGAGSVVLQALQYALSQRLDVGVGLRVSMNQLQLQQAALLQQHATIAGSCGDTGWCNAKRVWLVRTANKWQKSMPAKTTTRTSAVVCGFVSHHSCCRHVAWPRPPTAGRQACGSTPAGGRRG